MMTIRQATIEDADATARVQVQSWLETYRGIVPDGYLQSLTDTLSQRQQRHRDKIAANDSIQLVGCNDEGNVVGWLAAGNARAERPRSMGYTGEIYAIYLVKSAWRQGLGRAMMREAFDRLARDGPTVTRGDRRIVRIDPRHEL